jgi:hypothetical protein
VTGLISVATVCPVRVSGWHSGDKLNITGA